MTVETCPTFVMNGDEIVEVYYTDWQPNPSGQWCMVGQGFQVSAMGVDRVVLESPVGCFEWRVPRYAGSFSLQPGPGGSIAPQPCRRRSASADEVPMSAYE